ncbi:MAG: RNA polymerase sigma factor [Caulobacteraceae bacterium]
MCEADERRRWFRESVLPLRYRLNGVAAKFCRGRPDEVDDLVQETFTRIYKHPDWRSINLVEHFALRTLRNVGIDHLRRQQVVSLSALEDARIRDLADDVPSAERVVSAREELALLTRLIAGLPTQCRRAFTLCKIYGLSHEEVAVQLGLSVSTVEKHISKGLRLCSEGMASSPVAGGKGGAARRKAEPCADRR